MADLVCAGKQNGDEASGANGRAHQQEKQGPCHAGERQRKWAWGSCGEGGKGACFMQKETEGLLSLGHMEEVECQHMACCDEKKREEAG